MAEESTLTALHFRIGTRGSPLALAQATAVANALSTSSDVTTEIVPIVTSGDRIQDRRLIEAGGKGLFTKELDIALDRNEVDILVHSLKDVPIELPPGQEMLAVLPREDAREAFICDAASHPRDLPAGAIIGTASLRRGAQTLSARPDLRIEPLRGNVQTRLGKVQSGDFAATFLAMAGLNRLGMEDPSIHPLPVDDMLPAAGQGIVAITANRDQLGPERTQLLTSIDDDASHIAAVAERGFLGHLDGSCRTAMAAHYRQTGTGEIRMDGAVYAPDGSATHAASETRNSGLSRSEAHALGVAIAQRIQDDAGDGLPRFVDG